MLKLLVTVEMVQVTGNNLYHRTYRVDALSFYFYLFISSNSLPFVLSLANIVSLSPIVVLWSLSYTHTHMYMYVCEYS